MKCTGIYCPMQHGYDVENCKLTDCKYKTMPTTNYYRIKAMSVEEMAKVLNEMSIGIGRIDCEKYCAYIKDGRCNKFENDGKGSCVDGIKLWLESEVEENGK